jgi:Flp pilus assembly protein TadD
MEQGRLDDAFVELRLANERKRGCASLRRMMRDLIARLLDSKEKRNPGEILKSARYVDAAVEEGARDDPEWLTTLGRAEFAAGHAPEALGLLEAAVRQRGATWVTAKQLERVRAALVPDLPTFASIDRALERSDEELLIPEGSAWRFLRGTREPSGEPLGWTRLEYDEGGWEEGPSGFGYGDGDDETVLDDMAGTYTSVYLRKRFSVAATGAYRELLLTVTADDGFVAYLNGREIGRLRVQPDAAWIPFEAMAAGDAAEPVVPFVLRVPSALLLPGENVVALQGLNRSRSSSDFTLIPALKGIRPAAEQRDRELLEAFRRVATGDDDAVRLAYLEGRVLQRAGKHGEATKRLSLAARRAAGEPEPLLRLAECLREEGKPAEAEKQLRARLLDRDGPPAAVRLWNLWAAICLADLEVPPKELLSRLPAPGEVTGKTGETGGEGGAAVYVDDLRWLLGRLARGEPIRLNCGGADFADEDGRTWGRDRFSLGGRPALQESPIDVGGTEDGPLYLTERWFPLGEIARKSYGLPVPRGDYRVTLHFAEVFLEEAGRRRFDVSVEGKMFLRNYGPPFRSSERRAVGVPVRDGLLEIEFSHGVANHPKISAIEIERVSQ